jgi:hypothetical protein
MRAGVVMRSIHAPAMTLVAALFSDIGCIPALAFAHTLSD